MLYIINIFMACNITDQCIISARLIFTVHEDNGIVTWVETVVVKIGIRMVIYKMPFPHCGRDTMLDKRFRRPDAPIVFAIHLLA